MSENCRGGTLKYLNMQQTQDCCNAVEMYFFVRTVFDRAVFDSITWGEKDSQKPECSSLFTGYQFHS